SLSLSLAGQAKGLLFASQFHEKPTVTFAPGDELTGSGGIAAACRVLAGRAAWRCQRNRPLPLKGWLA
ncbi:hypothetical protein, partial [Burkholderia anthina]|uniref:hypothetical protein n=1 Tax=Burkholderia anthina TaxID=179879 RepID=UPI0033418889